MKYWIVDNFNVSKIASKLEEIYNIESLNKKFIYSYIFILRKIISSFLRNVYSIERLASNNANNILCIDESLFTHTDGMQTWIVGIINTDTNEIRLEVVTNRNKETLKAIVKKHIGIGNTVYSDSWAGYNFLHNPNSGYNHNVINHNHGIFGLTSRIEGLWGDLKSTI